MNAVELITREVSELPEPMQAQVLDFIAALKAREQDQPAAAGTPDDKAAELRAFFAPYQRDMSAFVFDREEANAR